MEKKILRCDSFSQKQKSNWTVIRGKKDKFCCFIQTSKVEVLLHGKNQICIFFHETTKNGFYYVKITPFLLILTKSQQLNRSVIRGKNHKFCFWTIPQKMKSFIWKKQICVVFHETTKNKL